MTDQTATQRYVNALMRSYELLTEAATRANERGLAMGKRFLDDVVAGHKEASELGQRIAGNPDQVTASYPSIMAATLTAQARALSFAQLISDASSSSTEESKELVNQLAETSREVSEAGAALVSAWTAENPLAAMAQRSMEAWGMGGANPSQ